MKRWIAIAAIVGGGVFALAQVRLMVASFSSDSVVAGQPVALTLEIRDADGALDSTYRGTVHFSAEDFQAVLPEDYPFTAQDAGSHTFEGEILFFTDGTKEITITDGILTTVVTVEVIQ